ncbi:uncharacterized protein LOC108164657 isoform X1 [Drosophila miranda]|uniref:uncharacterized protein LOC108164657 isoform X1 n=1 Tax=Drosophila miranda TaxID=7229 RepID=UPI00143F9C66|nr:uncharacterized protein LOC108164657 isoform X1 [Drosophila miranda]
MSLQENNTSLSNMLSNLKLNENITENKRVSFSFAVSPYTALSFHQFLSQKNDDLPCKLPQMGEAGNSDDENTPSRDSSSVIFVDSDDSLSAVSFFHLSEINSTSAEDNILIEETEPEETISRSNFSLGNMDQRSSRKRGTSGESPASGSVEKYQSVGRASTPTNPTVVTRSGRAVRTVLDTTFDYSSSQPEGEDESISFSIDSDDDDDYNVDQSPTEHKWVGRKQRRFSYQHSSSSEANSPKSDRRLIYIDLSQSVAIVGDNPVADLSVDDDPELKTKLHKFLGLIAPRRRLYNPMDNFDDDPDNSPQKETLPVASKSHLTETTTLSTPKRLITPITPTSSNTWSMLNTSKLYIPTFQERQAKFYDDLIVQVNSTFIETQTPAFLKEPIDLSGLPSDKQRASICRRHNGSIACLEQHPLFYGFVESLNPQNLINMCHPRALPYRKGDFEKCKVALAKVLFSMFNHAIFHCGLQAKIYWKNSMSTPCSSELGFNSSGNRTARILLWKHINQPGMLIKPLLHEMCHVAAFVFNRETGHGDNCRKWAYQAKSLIPELALNSDCDASYKYSCTLCARCSYGLVTFKNEAELLRCQYCQFEVNVERWRITDTQKIWRLNQFNTPFKTFVRENYLLVNNVDTHSAKMQILNRNFMDRETT